MDLRVMLGLVVRKERKVTWEREVSRVIEDLQVHKEKLVREESQVQLANLVNLVQLVQMV